MILKIIKKKASEKKLILSFYVLVSIVSWGVSLVLPYVLGGFIDQLTLNPNKAIIYKFTTVMVIIALSTVITSYIANIQMTKISNEFSYELKEKLLQHLLDIRQKSVQEIDSSNIAQKIFSDSDEIIKFIIQNFLGLFTKSLTVIYVIIFLIKTNTNLSYMLFVLTPLYFVVYFFFRKKVYNANFLYKEELNSFFGTYVHRIENLYHIKINDFAHLTLNEIAKAFDKMLLQVIRFSKIAFGFSSIGSIVGSLFNISLVFLGGMQIVNGNLTIGTFTIISSYLTIYIGSIEYLLTLGKDYQQFLVSVKRMEDILNIETENNGEIQISEIQEIKIEKLKYFFEKNNVLFDIEEQIFKKGNIYSITGKNGAGKSTLINLLCKIYDDYTGDIYINNENIKNVDIKHIRRHNIAFLEQNVIFYKDSVNENLVHGLENYNNDMLLRYKREFNVIGLVSRDNENEWGITDLSGGEKQKIGLIRTFLKTSDVIILDEPSSFLDQKSILSLKKMVLECKEQNKIVLLITHDESISTIADYNLNI